MHFALSRLYYSTFHELFGISSQVWDYTGLGYARYHARDVNKDFLG